MQTKNIFQGVKESVMHLNHWITSIEQSFNFEMQDFNSNETIINRSIFDKLRKHQSGLSRIVEICLKLANKNISDEMLIVNESILIVKERFEKLYENVAIVVKRDEIDNFNEKCYKLASKIQVYNNIMNSFFRLFDVTNKSDSISHPIKDYIRNLNQIFHQYKLEIDEMQSIVSNVGNKIYDDIFYQLTFFIKSLLIIETMIDTQWKFLIHIIKFHDNRTYLPINEIEYSSQYIEEDCEYVSQYAQLNSESLFFNIVSEKKLAFLTMASELQNGKHEWNIEEKDLPCENGKSEILFQDFTLLRLLLCSIFDYYTNSNYVKFFCEPKLMSTSICQSKIYKGNYTSNYNIKCAPISNIPNKIFPIAMRKYLPNNNVLDFINSSIRTISEKNEFTNDNLFKNLLCYNELYPSNFQRKYEFLSNLYFTKSESHTSLNHEVHSLPESRSDLVLKEKTSINDEMSDIDFFDESSGEKSNINQNIDIYYFFKRCIQFDFSMGCLLLCKEIVFYLINNFYFNHVLVSMTDIFQYTRLSTTV